MNGKKGKLIAGALAMSMVLSGTAYATVETSKTNGSISKVAATRAVFVNGDVDGDGEVKLEDAQLALKGALKIKSDFTELQKYAADVNSDGQLDLTDAQLILKAALKIQTLPEKEAPVESPEPAQSQEPEETPAPTQTPTPKPVASKRPTPPPAESIAPPTRTPVPTAPSIPQVTPADYVVEGQAADLIATNGAVEANGVYTFTDANKTASKGIQFKWPYSGRKDLRQTFEEAGMTLDKILAIPKEYKLQGELKKILAEKGTIDYEYPRPQWTNGISVSFWSKQKWDLEHMSNAGPLLIIKRSNFCDRNQGIDIGGWGGAKNQHGKKDDCDFGFMLSANGTVSLLSGDEAKNGFHAGNLISDKDNEWTHYTVTFANDFITVYVNGQEMVYQSINLDKDTVTECFNGGYMTKYNPAALITQEMLDKDIRGYLTAPLIASEKRSAWCLDTVTNQYTTNWEATLLGNSTYDGEHVASNYMLLVDLLTEDNVEMYLGGVPAGTACCINDGKTGFADYHTPTGSQVTGVMCYESELKPAEVAAIYENSKNTYKDVLGLQ